MARISEEFLLPNGVKMKNRLRDLDWPEWIYFRRYLGMVRCQETSLHCCVGFARLVSYLMSQVNFLADSRFPLHKLFDD